MRRIVFFCGPRGAGKGTLVEAVLRVFPKLERMLAETTRTPRIGELDGDQYHFCTEDEFEMMLRLGLIAEWEQIGPEQRSGLSWYELLRHTYAVADVVPRIARSSRKTLEKHGGRVLIIGVDAPLEERRKRIKLRQPNLSWEQVDKLIADDPVDLAMCDDLDHLIHNDCDGNPGLAIRKASRLIKQFLNGG